ncbi:MAG TPA: hypothetical protein VHS09_14055 [Polyangiaceae bacterium]|nr:hypothetical protein [Polyangiaceae bacterium]
MKVNFIRGALPGALLSAAACSSAASPSASACPANSGASDVGDGGEMEFVAYESSFSGFQSWPNTAQATAQDDAGDGLHGVGPLQVYWNQTPSHGSTSFPVGTIIVKETEDSDPTQRITFAMVKRGGGYNAPPGANGWEWFSLQNNADGCTVTILWRGLVAPPGQTYANQAIGDCNGCHTAAAANDSVWDSALQLSSF